MGKLQSKRTLTVVLVAAAVLAGCATTVPDSAADGSTESTPQEQRREVLPTVVVLRHELWPQNATRMESRHVEIAMTVPCVGEDLTGWSYVVETSARSHSAFRVDWIQVGQGEPFAMPEPFIAPPNTTMRIHLSVGGTLEASPTKMEAYGSPGTYSRCLTTVPDVPLPRAVDLR